MTQIKFYIAIVVIQVFILHVMDLNKFQNKKSIIVIVVVFIEQKMLKNQFVNYVLNLIFRSKIFLVIFII